MTEDDRNKFLSEIKKERAERLSYLEAPNEAEQEATHESRGEDIKIWYEELCRTRPGYFEAEHIVDVYEKSRSAHERNEVGRMYIRRFFTDPYFLENFFDQLDHVAVATGKEVKGIKEDLSILLDETIKKEGLGFSPEHSDVVKRWLELYTHSEGHGARVEEAMRLVMQHTRGLDGYARNLQTISYATLQSTDPEVLVTGLKVLSRDKPILAGDYRDVDQYIAGLISPDDDVLKRIIDIDAFFELFASRYYPEGLINYRQRIDDYFKIIQQEIAEGKQRSQYMGLLKKGKEQTVEGKKIRDLQKYHAEIRQNRGAQVVSVDVKKYPYTLFMQPEHMTEMRKLLNKKLADILERERGNVYKVYKPGQGEVVTEFDNDDEAQQRPYIKEWFSHEEKRLITEESVFDTIALIFPRLTGETKALLAERVSSLKRELKYDARCLVSPRGDEILINDSFLSEEIGISSLVFKPRTSVIDLDVQIVIGKNTCVLGLDDFFALRRAGETKSPLDISVDTKLILTELIISHLQKLLCGSVTTEGGSLSNLDGESHSAPVRRAHLRKLPPGKGFTLEQAAMAAEEYHVDLARYNTDRGRTREQGQFTFVSPVTLVSFEEAKKMPPSRSVFSNASQLREVFEKK